MKKTREQKGSVTLFVLVACLFMIMVLLLVNIAIINKNTSQEKELAQIGKNYAVNEIDMANSYAKIADENGYPNYSEVQKMIEDAVKKAKEETKADMEKEIEDIRKDTENKINSAVEEVTGKAKLEAFPIGSIYFSTSPTNPSTYIGGTWESYGQGRTLIGAGTGTDSNNTSQLFKVGATGGEYTYRLAISQLPSHNHTITPTGTIASSFAGSAVNTTTNGGHNHSFSTGGQALVVGSNSSHNAMGSDSRGFNYASSGGWFNGMKKNASSIASNGDHAHTVTAAGTVSSAFYGNNGATSAVGSGTAINQLQPYIVTYMWKRTK